MKIVSLNVGCPRLLSWKGKTFSTGIFKQPAAGRVMLRRTNLDGDRQADLRVHGGPDKAVYGYPSEHYPFWKTLLSAQNLPWASFGENLTTEDVLETEVSVGDHFRIGSAVVMAKTPRLPCFKLAAKFQRDEIIQEFLKSGRCGYYFSVVEEGELGAGDRFQFLGGETPTVTISEVFRLFSSDLWDIELLERAARAKSLPESWRKRFQTRLAAAAAENKI